jgi:hypothetical protein
MVAYFKIYANTQQCSGRTAFKITRLDVRWSRPDTTILVKSPQSKVGYQQGVRCDGRPLNWEAIPSFTGNDLAFTEGANNLHTKLKTFTWSGAPYGRCQSDTSCADAEWAGGYVKSTFYRRSTGATIWTPCPEGYFYGNGPC